MERKKVKNYKKTNWYDCNLPLYNIAYSIIISDTISKCVKLVNETFKDSELTVSPECAAYAVELAHPEYGSEFVICLESDPKLSMHSIIPHESLHLSWFICSLIGLKLDYDNHEAQAYILGEITEHAFKALEDYNKQYKVNKNKK